MVDTVHRPDCLKEQPVENTLIKTPLPTNIYIRISCRASPRETLQEGAASEIRVRIPPESQRPRSYLRIESCFWKADASAKNGPKQKKEETRPAGGVSSAFQALLLPGTVLAPGNTGASFEPKTHFVSVA